MKFKTSKEMDNLLGKIDEVDLTSNYSYHPVALRIVDEKSLLEVLREIYSQDFLTIYNPRNSDGSFLQADDITIMEKTNAYHLVILENSTGIVGAVNEDFGTYVEFRSINIQLFFNPESLYVIGRKSGLFRRDKKFPPTRGDYFHIRKNDIVRTLRARFEHQRFNPHRLKLTPGTKGKFKHWKPTRASSAPGHYYNARFPLAEFSFSDGVKIEAAVDPKKAVIRKKNEVNFEKLYAECFTGGLE